MSLILLAKKFFCVSLDKSVYFIHKFTNLTSYNNAILEFMIFYMKTTFDNSVVVINRRMSTNDCIPTIMGYTGK